MRKKMLILFFILSSCNEMDRKVDEKNIKNKSFEFENNIVIPENGNISEFDRYYFFGEKYIDGLLIHNDQKKGDVKIVHDKTEFPEISDGGCGIVHVKIEMDSKKIVYIFCRSGS
jgi:hypothetical protein